jgi:hypothetical protein
VSASRFSVLALFFVACSGKKENYSCQVVCDDGLAGEVYPVDAQSLSGAQSSCEQSRVGDPDGCLLGGTVTACSCFERATGDTGNTAR